MQWHGTILPRIHKFLPAGRILEIGPGFGRFTSYLLDHCGSLVLVDLAETCIRACEARFGLKDNIEYHVNDGKSLHMLDDSSIDFAFSLDSLVHAEDDVIRAYVDGLARKLSTNGIAFLHHSNLAERTLPLAILRKIRILRQHMVELGALTKSHDQWRGESVSASGMRSHIRRAGLRTVAQELVNWNSSWLDC